MIMKIGNIYQCKTIPELTAVITHINNSIVWYDLNTIVGTTAERASMEWFTHAYVLISVKKTHYIATNAKNMR